MTHRVAQLVASSLICSAFLIMSAPSAEAFPYRFCTEDVDTPSQELIDAIAAFLDARYEGDVKWVKAICFGPNPRMNNRETWVYQAEFSGGEVLDVAVIESSQGRQISVQDSRERDADGNGWTKWQALD